MVHGTATPDEQVLVSLGISAALLAQHRRQPRYQSAFTQFVTDKRGLIGCGLISHQRLRIENSILDTGALQLFMTAHATPSEYEQVLGAVLPVCADAGMALTTLYDQSKQAGAYGFAPTQLSTIIADWQRTPPTQQATDSVPLDDIAALYRALPLPIVPDRTAADWQAWQEQDRTVWLEQDQQGRVTAFASGFDGLIDEAAAADAGAARALLAHLPQQVRLTLTLAHPVAQAALQLGGQATVLLADESTGHTQLSGVISVNELLRQLAPALTIRITRSRYAGWSGRVAIETSAERAMVQFDHGRASVVDGGPADVRMRQVGLAALAQASMGYRAIDDLRATGELICDNAELGLLSLLFPVV